MDYKHPVTANIQQLIKILSENLALDPRTPIREYIANAHDATLNVSKPKIEVWIKDKQLLIRDNGVGMTEHVILEAYTRIGGHHSEGDESESIGMFGIGVLSAFMIARSLVVETKSEADTQGWRLVWYKGETNFTLEPIEKLEPGTLAIMTLEEGAYDLLNEEMLKRYIQKTFSLLAVPIYVNHRKAANTHYEWLADIYQSYSSPLFLKDHEAFELMGMFTLLPMAAIYFQVLEDGTRIFIGIPQDEHSPLDIHKVFIFSKGTKIYGGLRAFLPENLAFSIVLIDHPHLELQISRETFMENESYRRLRNSIEVHVIRSLTLLARENDRLFEAILQVHRIMLIAHGERSGELRKLLKTHFRFVTSNGEQTWQEITAFANIESDKRVVYAIFTEIEAFRNLQDKRIKGYITVYAFGAERILLEQFAREDGVEVRDALEMEQGIVSKVPEPFIKLGAAIGNYLIRKGIRGGVAFIQLPGEGQFPAMFQIKTTEGKLMLPLGQPITYEKSHNIHALLLNLSHPLIIELARKNLAEATLKQAADALYYIANLHTPFEDLLLSNAEEMMKFMMEAIRVKIGSSKMGGKSTPPPDGANCFVAFPYADEFNPVWEGIHSVFSKEPYNWSVIRGDHHINGEFLLESIDRHINTSHRVIADVSGRNENVLLELGMAIGNSHKNNATDLLVLCDEETFPRLPTDLKGLMPLVYPSKIRENAQTLENWLRKKVISYKKFIALRGVQSNGKWGYTNSE